jgi:spore germination protein GerM
MVGLGVGALLRGLPPWFARAAPPPPPPVTIVAPPTGQGPKIKARLFYIADDGEHLVGVERDVPYSNQTAEQARAILQAQLAEVQQPQTSAIPAGTQLRAVYITPDGEAYIDLSRDLAVAHPGGLTNERLTIYTLVHALTINLPAVTAVQLLVDGKEVDTLAGHVDLRRPLTKHLQLVLGP